MRQNKFICILTLLCLLSPSHGYANQASKEGVVNSFKNDLTGNAINQALLSHSIVMIGEIHGTQQSPDLVARLVLAALKQGKVVLVGLEHIPDEREQSFVEETRQSQTAAELLKSPYWRQEYQDGRYSKAMLHLLEELRSLNKKYPKKLSLVQMDGEDPDEKGDAGFRDRHMAGRLRDAIKRHTPDFTVTLTGNLHNRRRIDNGPSMAYQLSDLKPWTVKTIFGTGEAWICQTSIASECGVTALGGRGGQGAVEKLVIADNKTSNDYHAYFYFPKVSASPPAAKVVLPNAKAH